MKTLPRLLTALLLLLAVLLCAHAEGDEITVGVPTDRCPVFYQDPDTGEILGIGVDLLRTAAENSGFTVTFRGVGEQTLKQALDNPDYDLVMPFGSAIDSAAGQPTVVSDNLFQTPFTIVTRSGQVVPPLNELRLGMLHSQGGVVETIHTLYPGIEIEMYDSMGECVRALRTGRVDALLHNSYVWSYTLQKPSYADLSAQPSSMFAMDFRAGALDTPAGRDLVGRLNTGIGALTDTRRQAIILDYTSRRLYRYDLSDYLYLYGAVVLLGALLMLAIVVIAVMHVKALRRHQEEKIRQMIDYDALTGLLSLQGFRKRVEELLRAHPDVPYMLAYNNIRNFKYINDSLGMDAGDELLRYWAEKCRLMQTDLEALGRVGGDRIAALMCMPDEEKLRRDDREVLTPVRNYFIDRGRENQVQISSGVYVLTPEDYRHIDVDRMLDFARVTEKRQRTASRDGYEVYNPALWERGKRSAEIVSHLPMAVLTGELQVWYQPQMNYETGRITGMEALCRWQHPALGWISPAEFVPVLEDAGLIFELDRFVWETVCKDLRRWNGQGSRQTVSVNLSRRDIGGNRDIPGYFQDLIRGYGLSPDQLRIEITETAFVEDPDGLIQTVSKLQALGFAVEMDDFGSGYSSLHMLKEVPVDRIKLDLHFLTAGGDPEKARVIVSYMIQMIHSLGLSLIAEGVETAEQASFLHGKGCEEMQGYFFAHPMPAEELKAANSEQHTANSE